MALIKGKQLADLAISSSKIANLSITSGKLAGDSVLPAKIDKTQTFDFSSGVLRVGTPSGNTDVANKAYVDSVAGTGLEVKESVRVLDKDSDFDSWTYSSGVLDEGTANALNLTVDGVQLSLNDRILVQGQTTQTENGIYTLSREGDGSTVTFQLTRASDFDATSDISANNFFFIEEGSSYADTGWVLTTNESITLDSTNLTFQQFSGAGSITAGNGIVKSGNTLSAQAESNKGLAVSASGVGVDFTNVSSLGSQTPSTDSLLLKQGSSYVATSPGAMVEAIFPTTAGFSFDVSKIGSLNLLSTGGLQLNSNQFSVKIDGNSLTSDANGLSVQLNSENSVVETTGGLTASILRTNRLGLTPSAVSSSTASTGHGIPSGITIASGSAVSVFVNGIKANLGATTSSQCFFSADSGSTAKALNAIVAADTLYWNPTATGSYALETTDVLDIIYASVTA